MESTARFAIPDKMGALSFGERLLLWSIRMWVCGYKDGANTQSTIQHGFELAGLPDLYGKFDDFMYLVASTATQDIVIWDVECLEVSDDEHLLLGVVAAWQQGHGKDHGTALLSTWLPMSAIRLSQPALSKIAHAMASRKMIIRPRCHRHSEYIGDNPSLITNTHGITLH